MNSSTSQSRVLRCDSRSLALSLFSSNTYPIISLSSSHTYPLLNFSYSKHRGSISITSPTYKSRKYVVFGEICQALNTLSGLLHQTLRTVRFLYRCSTISRSLPIVRILCLKYVLASRINVQVLKLTVYLACIDCAAENGHETCSCQTRPVCICGPISTAWSHRP